MVVIDCIVVIEKRGAERDAKKGLIVSLGWDSQAGIRFSRNDGTV